MMPLLNDFVQDELISKHGSAFFVKINPHTAGEVFLHPDGWRSRTFGQEDRHIPRLLGDPQVSHPCASQFAVGQNSQRTSTKSRMHWGVEAMGFYML
jgi:hypothetical protein